MADFMRSYKRTLVNEGGWCNDAGDSGKETFAGVARAYHGDWVGWKIIDAIKPHCKDIKTLNAALFMNTELMNNVRQFYKNEFWDINQEDKFTSQLLAENVFDAAVNCGTGTGIKFLQRALNNLNPSYNLTIDGGIGPNTFSAMNDALSKFGEQQVVNAYIAVRRKYYNDIVANNPSQKVFLNNWLSRCNVMAKEA